MAIVYCEYCSEHVDMDYHSEHFNSDGECIENMINDLKENGLTDEEIDAVLDGQ